MGLKFFTSVVMGKSYNPKKTQVACYLSLLEKIMKKNKVRAVKLSL
jgi:hypothetical protein